MFMQFSRGGSRGELKQTILYPIFIESVFSFGPSFHEPEVSQQNSLGGDIFEHLLKRLKSTKWPILNHLF